MEENKKSKVGLYLFIVVVLVVVNILFLVLNFRRVPPPGAVQSVASAPPPLTGVSQGYNLSLPTLLMGLAVMGNEASLDMKQEQRERLVPVLKSLEKNRLSQVELQKSLMKALDESQKKAIQSEDFATQFHIETDYVEIAKRLLKLLGGKSPTSLFFPTWAHAQEAPAPPAAKAPAKAAPSLAAPKADPSGPPPPRAAALPEKLPKADPSGPPPPKAGALPEKLPKTLPPTGVPGDPKLVMPKTLPPTGVPGDPKLVMPKPLPPAGEGMPAAPNPNIKEIEPPPGEEGGAKAMPRPTPPMGVVPPPGTAPPGLGIPAPRTTVEPGRQKLGENLEKLPLVLYVWAFQKKLQEKADFFTPAQKSALVPLITEAQRLLVESVDLLSKANSVLTSDQKFAISSVKPDDMIAKLQEHKVPTTAADLMPVVIVLLSQPRPGK